jgi:lysozyme
MLIFIVLSVVAYVTGDGRMTLRPLVVDINHADGSLEENGKHVDLIDFAKVRAAGFLGVIHKATEGEHFVDPLYAERRPKALAAGLLWGAYHFMRPGDVGNQISKFLTVVQHPRSSVEFTRFALDYEDEKCALGQAERWLDLVHTVTTQVPWLYGGGVLKEQIGRIHRQTLGQYPLWLSEYGPVAKVPLPWNKFVLWQRSGDGEGPGIHDVPGIGRKQDINYFDGTDEELKAAWLDMGPGASGVA